MDQVDTVSTTLLDRDKVVVEKMFSIKRHFQHLKIFFKATVFPLAVIGVFARR